MSCVMSPHSDNLYPETTSELTCARKGSNKNDAYHALLVNSNNGGVRRRGKGGPDSSCKITTRAHHYNFNLDTGSHTESAEKSKSSINIFVTGAFLLLLVVGSISPGGS